MGIHMFQSGFGLNPVSEKCCKKKTQIFPDIFDPAATSQIFSSFSLPAKLLGNKKLNKKKSPFLESKCNEGATSP